MNERPPYSRIYWSVMDDAKFDGIREDCRVFGAWSLMLVVADMAWPSPAFVPPTVSRASLARLVEAELVDVLPGYRYRIHGLDAERERRSEAGRVGGLASGRSRGATPPVERPLNDRRTTVERIVNESKAKAVDEAEDESVDEAPRAPDPADAYWSLTGKYPNGGALSWIDDMASSYGPEAVVRAIAKAHLQDKSVATLLGRAQDILRAEARALDKKSQTEVRLRLEERRAAPRVVVDQEAVNAEIRKLLEVAA